MYEYSEGIMTPEDSARILQEELARLAKKEDELDKTRKALQSEFAKATNPDDIANVDRNAIRDIMPDAVMQLKTLINYAESESVRASLSKFVIATGLDKSKIEDGSSSDLNELLKQLAANDTPAEKPE
jgi:hypothetical protein